MYGWGVLSGLNRIVLSYCIFVSRSGRSLDGMADALRILHERGFCSRGLVRLVVSRKSIGGFR